MPAPDPSSASDWPQRRYSYAAVLTLAGVGAAFPGAAWALLGPPLAVGMVVLGVAHGACDQLVVPAGQPRAGGWRYWLVFLAGYLGLAGLVGALWWGWPVATVAGFFLLTVWHWGSADTLDGPRASTVLWLTHSLLRGLLLFAVPAWWWPTATAGIVNGLLAFAGAPAVAGATFAAGAGGLGLLVVGGHLALWACYAYRHQWALLRTEVFEVAVLVGLLLALPPQLSVGVYFVFWHSLQHVLRLTSWLGYAPAPGSPRTGPALWPQLGFFLRRAAPLLLLSCAALLLLGRLLAPHLPNGAAWFSLALVVASIVTLPHALLVTLVMDAPRWHGPRATP
ncbi:Brp/Blh family beta-carotene 15,15'-dioxygenase [Hymenobacter caeli]|uniref:Probable beta-carotene 15,15'-dioxygenase n=1 Tax=Hymenobacter caeli TaxID=2735894 RepID=A0ABX2FJQ3_9BACT|nr:Brp/Blh family beta-carotene 15,15'-dioxygenase [Hymenobacter caeli]NRT17338.1 Brp/Blh family beta-carotene 15,15'-monooxygenase [Hymenobacter caeli]